MAVLRKVFSSGVCWAWVVILVIAVDRLSKAMVLSYLVPYTSYEVWPFFNLTLTFNRGAAFSFLNRADGWQNLLFVSLAVVVCLFIFHKLYRLPKQAWWMNIALCLVCGGAIGNVWDRLLYGYVVDFLNFHINQWHFAIFNVADSAICVGGCMLILYWRKLTD